MSANQGYVQTQPADNIGDFNPRAAQIDARIARIRTILWCQVLSVTPGVGGAPATVSVQPLVGMFDGMGNIFPHGTISNVPALRLQAGNVAIVVDPVVGDKGFMLVCDRDSTAAKANLAPCQANTGRMHNMQDAVYLGGWGTTAPTQFLKFNQAGGWTLEDSLGNSMTSSLGFVDFVIGGGTGVLRVNGTPVTVP